MWKSLTLSLLALGLIAAAREPLLVTLSDDPFSPNLVFGSQRYAMEKHDSALLTQYSFVARQPRSGAWSDDLQISVHVIYQDKWRHYAAARLKGGTPVENVIPLKKEVISCMSARFGGACMLYENVLVPLPSEWPREQDFEFQLVSSTPIVVVVPADQIGEFRSKMAALKVEPQGPA